MSSKLKGSEGKKRSEAQKRVFTRWVNSFLKKKKTSVETLKTGFKTGINLIHLFESVAEQKIGKYNKKPKLEVHCIDNLSKVVKKINVLCKEVGVKVDYSPHQFYQGDEKAILGLIWVMILRFQINDITEEEQNAKDGLLLWCKKKTKDYKNVSVSNFHKSFMDGLAFCALIHKHYPSLIKYEDLKKENAKENLELAFTVAEKEFDIPRLLEPEDFEVKPDVKSVLTYVSYYWKKFAAGEASKKLGGKIARIMDKLFENGEAAEGYEKEAKELIEWIESSIEKMSAKDFGKSLEKMNEISKIFKEMKTQEKPGKNTKKVEIELELNNLQSKQKTDGLKIYQPEEEVSTETIEKKWQNFEEESKKYETELKEAIKNMKKIEHLVKRFNSRAESTEEYQKKKIDEVKNEVDEETIKELKTTQEIGEKVNKMKSFEKEIINFKKIWEDTKEIGKDIIEKGHESSEKIEEKTKVIDESFDDLNKTVEESTKKLNDLLKKFEDVEKLILEFNDLQKSIYAIIDNAKLSLMEPVVGESVEEVETQEKEHLSVHDKVENEKENIDKIKNLAEDIKSSGVEPPSYDNLEKDFNEVLEKLNEKKEELKKEKELQTENEELIQNLTEDTKKYVSNVDVIINDVNKFEENSEEKDLKKILENIKEMEEKIMKENEDRIKDLKDNFSKIDEKNIIERCDVTIEELEAEWEPVPKAFASKIQTISQKIASENKSKVPEEKIKEFHETFKFFDKDNDETLNLSEFKAAVTAIDGIFIKEEKLESVFKEYDVDQDSLLSFSEFIEFMMSVSKDTINKEDVVEAFKELAGGKDEITEEQLRKVIDSEETMDKCLKSIPKNDETNALKYLDFISNTYA